MGSLTYELFDALGDMGVDMGEMGDMSEVFDMLEGMMGGAALSSIISGVSNLALGAYYICSGLWMSSVHKEIVAINLERSREAAKLSDIEKKTKDAVNIYEIEKARAAQRKKEAEEEAERQRKQKEEADRQRKMEEEAAELARQRQLDANAQRQAQEQQQMMMQMMQQMMETMNSAQNKPSDSEKKG